MHKQHAKELMEFLFPVMVILLVVSLIFWKFAYGANPPKEQPYGCAWIDCRPNQSGKTVCSGPVYGSHQDLVRVIQSSEQGAVSYDCGPGKGEKK